MYDRSVCCSSMLAADYRADYAGYCYTANIACCTDLSNAEAYYWSYSLHPAFNYYDHPPMVAWLIGASTPGHFVHHEVFIHMRAITRSAVTTWLFFVIGTAMKNPQTGWITALLYTTSSMYASLIAGTYITRCTGNVVLGMNSSATAESFPGAVVPAANKYSVVSAGYCSRLLYD